jgi:hypothetical protein
MMTEIASKKFPPRGRFYYGNWHNADDYLHRAGHFNAVEDKCFALLS